MKISVKAKEYQDEIITPDILQKAIAKGRLNDDPSLRAQTLRYLEDGQALMIGFADYAVVLPIKNYPEFAELDRHDLEALTLGYAGRELCLESKDLHVFIAGLLVASPPFMSMAKTIVATHNGKKVSHAKAAASRANGKRGGRPPKVAA